MFFKFPKDDKRFSWTSHIKNKMLFYGLSEQRIRSVLKSPTRVEGGVAEGTVAVMTPLKSKKRPEEVWVMYAVGANSKKKLAHEASPSSYVAVDKRFGNVGLKVPSKVTLISAWRYPGVSKPGERIPIPEEILAELGL